MYRNKWKMNFLKQTSIALHAIYFICIISDQFKGDQEGIHQMQSNYIMSDVCSTKWVPVCYLPAHETISCFQTIC